MRLRVHRRLAATVLVVALPTVASADLDELFRSLRLPSVPGQGADNPNVSSAIGRALNAAVASAVPQVSAPTSVRWEKATGSPQLTDGAQFYLEHAKTIGPRHTSWSLSYQEFELATFDGKDLDDLHDRGLLDGTTAITSLRVDLSVRRVVAAVRWGILDDVEVQGLLPLVATSLRLDQRATRRFGADVVLRFDRHASDSASGVGDVRLGAKWTVVRRGRLTWGDVVSESSKVSPHEVREHLLEQAARPHRSMRSPLRDGLSVAVGFDVNAPTGDEGDFQGTGSWRVAPGLFATWEPVTVASLRLQPYANARAALDAEDVDRSELGYGLGVDVGRAFGNWSLIVSAAYLARHGLEPVVSSQQLDRERIDVQSGEVTVAPLFGLSSNRPDFYDVALGMRLRIPERLPVPHPLTIIGDLSTFLSAVLPLNRDGARPEWLLMAGVELPLPLPPLQVVPGQGSGD